jgi:predicted O-methyltransferase YrrM
MLLRFLRYFWRAKTIYDVHSPFVAELTRAVLEDRRHFYAFSEIELLREQLRFDKTELHVKDHGAGSNVDTDALRKIADLARHAAVPPVVGRMLFRLVDFCKPGTILELGTSLGISTLYLRAGALNARLLTVEGSAEVAAQARANFAKQQVNDIEVYLGTFQEQLPRTLQDLQQLDFLYLDGDHREAATMNYVEQCLAYARTPSVFVIADIYWSNEMQAAWDRLRAHPRVRLSVDVFHFGILFFREEQREPEHFTLIAKRWKPWRLGFGS